MVTKLSPSHVEQLLSHPSEDIQYLATKWLEHFNKVEEGVRSRTNILKPAAALLTVDSQLKYELEDEDR